MQLHQVKGHRRRDGNSTGAKVSPESVCFVARSEVVLEETVVFVMVIDARFPLFLSNAAILIRCHGRIMPTRFGIDVDKRIELSEYGNVLLLSPLALDLTG